MSSDHANSRYSDPNLPYVFGLIGGGLCLGAGLLLLWYSFGYEVGSMADHLDTVGYSGLDNISRLGASDYSIGLILLGALTLIGLNAVGWKRTGGY